MTSSPPITILVVDDHPLIRAGLAAIIAFETDIVLVGEAQNGEEAIDRFHTLRPDVILMDIAMPVMDGIDAMRAILAEHGDARIVMLTTFDGDASIRQALALGARGYLLKDMLRREVLNVIRAVHAGHRSIPQPISARLAEFAPGTSLTPRETEILRLVARGASNPEIADLVGRSEWTVKVHMKNILQKLDVTDRTEAVTVAIKRGFIRLE